MNVGKIKAIIDRQRGYLGIFNFAMVGFLFFDRVGWEWYYLLLIPIWFLFAYLDVRYIIPREFDYLHRKSPVFKELLKK